MQTQHRDIAGLQDVGGITPGSMPPMSHTLAEEGAAILSFKLVKGGKFQVCPTNICFAICMESMHSDSSLDTSRIVTSMTGFNPRNWHFSRTLLLCTVTLQRLLFSVASCNAHTVLLYSRHPFRSYARRYNSHNFSCVAQDKDSTGFFGDRKKCLAAQQLFRLVASNTVQLAVLEAAPILISILQCCTDAGRFEHA